MEEFDLRDCSKAVVAYVPVVHRELLKFFHSQQALILVLGEDLIAEYSQLEHDLRAVRPDESVEMLTGLGFLARVISRDDILHFLSISSAVFVLPQDEVMTDFAERYLVGRTVEFHNIFTRWHKKNVTSEQEVNPNRMISLDDFDQEVMAVCIDEAQKSSDWWRQVGAVAVREGLILAMAFNKHLPTDFSSAIDGDIRQCFDFGERMEICGAIHAEAAVVSMMARSESSLLDADLYVSTFPCPMCARLIVPAGVRRLFYHEGYSVCDAFDILSAGKVEIVRVDFSE